MVSAAASMDSQYTQVADLPRQPGAATLLRLDNGRIAQVTTVGNAADLRAALAWAPPKTAP